MPQGLDQPSSISPSGYQEQTSQGALPPLPKGTKLDPTQAVKSLARKLDPSLTKHDIDYLMHVLENEGLIEKVYKPEFPKLLAPVVKFIAGSVGRVTQRAIGFPTVTGPSVPQPLVR
jgi:hypothetical protein